MEEALHRELWTSWASMLRAYAAAHGLTSTHHAVVEVGAEEIVLRVDDRWTRFTRHTMLTSGGELLPFRMHEDGKMEIGTTVDEMDLTAERVAREIFSPSLAG